MIIKRFLLAIPLVFAGWLAVITLVMRFSDAAPGAVVILPSAGFLQDLPDEVSVLAVTDFSVTLQSDMPSFAKAMYDRGAVLVLPAGLPGCLPLPRPAV